MTLAFVVPCAPAVAIGATDTTGCNSTTNSPLSLPQAPSTSTDTMEFTLGATGRAATPSDFSIAARSLNCDASTNCSTKCLGALRSLGARLNGLRALTDGLENLGDMETLNVRQNF